MPLIDNVTQLNERIKISKNDSYQSEDGDLVEGLVEVGECWAYVKTRMLRDVVTSIDNTSQDIINFVIRYDQEFEVDKTMEVTWRGNNYPIIKVNVDSGMKEFNVLVCRSIN